MCGLQSSQFKGLGRHDKVIYLTQVGFLEKTMLMPIYTQI